MHQHLRPLERRVLSLKEAGVSTDEIGRRFGRSPEHVERILEWAEIPRHRPAPRRHAEAFENRVLSFRAKGESYEQIGRRFDRSGDFIGRVERLAHYRRGRLNTEA